MSYVTELGKLIEMNLRMKMESVGISKSDIDRVFGEGGNTLNVMNQTSSSTSVSSSPQYNLPKKAYFISPYTPKSCAIIGISHLPDNVASALKTRATNTNTRGVMYNPRLKVGCNGYVFSANTVAEHNSIFEDHVTQVSYDEYVKLHTPSNECDGGDGGDGSECEEYSPEDAEKVFAALSNDKKPKSHPGAEAVVDTGTEVTEDTECDSDEYTDDSNDDHSGDGKEEETSEDDNNDLPSEDEKDTSSGSTSSEGEDVSEKELYITPPKDSVKYVLNKANKWGNSTDKEHGIIFKPLDVGKNGASIKVAVGVQDEDAPKSDRGCASILPLEENEEEVCKENNWVYLTDEVIAVVESRNPEAAKKLSSILYDD